MTIQNVISYCIIQKDYAYAPNQCRYVFTPGSLLMLDFVSFSRYLQINRQTIVIAIVSPTTNKRKMVCLSTICNSRMNCPSVLSAHFLLCKFIFYFFFFIFYFSIDLYEINWWWVENVKYKFSHRVTFVFHLAYYSLSLQKFKTFSCSNVLIFFEYFLVFCYEKKLDYMIQIQLYNQDCTYIINVCTLVAVILHFNIWSFHALFLCRKQGRDRALFFFVNS